MTGRLTRRRFAAAAAALPALAGPWPTSAAERPDRLSALAELGRLALARGILAPDDPDLAAVAALLSPSRRAAENLRRSVAGDFAAERVVRLDGWVLSETEVRLGVLVHLRLTDADGPAAPRGPAPLG